MYYWWSQFSKSSNYLSIYKLNNEHELVDEFKNLGSEHSNFVNDWTSEKIIVSTYAHVESFLKMLIWMQIIPIQMIFHRLKLNWSENLLVLKDKIFNFCLKKSNQQICIILIFNYCELLHQWIHLNQVELDFIQIKRKTVILAIKWTTRELLTRTFWTSCIKTLLLIHLN